MGSGRAGGRSVSRSLRGSGAVVHGVACFGGVFVWLHGSVAVVSTVPAPSDWRVRPSGARRAPHIACSGSFLLVRWWSSPPPSPVVFFLGGVCLILPVPFLGRCMHWSVSGVTYWLAEPCVPCSCVVCGLGPFSGSVRPAAYVNVWAGGLSCQVRF